MISIRKHVILGETRTYNLPKKQDILPSNNKNPPWNIGVKASGVESFDSILKDEIRCKHQSIVHSFPKIRIPSRTYRTDPNFSTHQTTSSHHAGPARASLKQTTPVSFLFSPPFLSFSFPPPIHFQMPHLLSVKSSN